MGTKLAEHIKTWNKAWFGLIFLGSIFNALSKELMCLSSIPSIEFISFALGLLIGLIAKYRGRWLWMLNKT